MGYSIPMYGTIFYIFPGQVESCLVLFDLRSVAVNDFPVKIIPEIIHLLSRQYPCRLNHMYVLHDSFFLQTAWKIVRNCLSPMQQEKVTLTRYDFGTLILKNFLPNQIEKDFGGTRENITSFYPFPLASGPYTLSEQNSNYVPKPNEWVKTPSSCLSEATSFMLRKNSLYEDNVFNENLYKSSTHDLDNKTDKNKRKSIVYNDKTIKIVSERFESSDGFFSKLKNSYSTHENAKPSLVLRETHSVEFSPSRHNFQMENLTSHTSMMETFPNSTLFPKHHETCFWLPFLSETSFSFFPNSKEKKSKTKIFFCFKRDKKMIGKTTHSLPRWPFGF
ncbi:uncharacterized protein LOC128883139 isoform X2 [Hylaeus volcanicus]|uniref:uncharacterized protein LOC128883139 isoform X2 n=1 Tax=Hylaeus volcanicus TaxID=313075 RepID=UPI0023B7D430|nr:uncharacterized protein LOC128883139 isoform X2 [Hylaeus volcanicus]